MPEIYIGSLALRFAALRLAVAVLFVLVAWRSTRRPAPRLALAALIAVNLGCWAAYVAPLQRPYGVSPGSDRGFNLGMAAATASGHSPFEHTQLGFGSPEPLWNALVAALALFDPQRVPLAYALLSPIAVVVLALGLYYGFRRPGTASGEWEAFWIVFAVLELSSLTMSPKPPAAPFWLGNVLLKPQHGLALGLVGLAAGLSWRASRRTLALGLLLGALAWAFLVVWAYAVVGLLVAALLGVQRRREATEWLAAVGLSTLIAAPLVAHLAGSFSPLAGHAAARHMWSDVRGLLLAVPNWTTLDLGPLLSLGALGAWRLRHATAARERTLLGLLGAAWGLWLLSVPAALAGLAPEPDELHYFVRFTTAIVAGLALAHGAAWLEDLRGWPAGRGHALLLALCTPLAFHAYWDPPTMDRYYPESLQPLGVKRQAAAAWIRRHTTPQAVFAAGPDAATWIPVLTGRRVLLNEAGSLLPADHASRKESERILLTSTRAAALREAARRYGVTHLAIDAPLAREYDRAGFARLAHSPQHHTVLLNSAVRLVELVDPAEPPRAAHPRP